MSTYNTPMHGNSQQILESIDEILGPAGLHKATDVRVSEKMMSLVYVRGIDWSVELEDMGKRFKKWLDTHK